MVVAYFVQHTFGDGELFAAPDDGVAGEACGPEAESGEVAQREEPEIGQHLMIGEHFGADHHSEREAQEETQSKKPQAEWAEAAGDRIQNGPSQTVGEDQTGVAFWPRVAHGSQPPQLVIGKAAPGVGRGAGLDHLSH